jgi:hypothetical protein
MPIAKAIDLKPHTLCRIRPTKQMIFINIFKKWPVLILACSLDLPSLTDVWFY